MVCESYTERQQWRKLDELMKSGDKSTLPKKAETSLIPRLQHSSTTSLKQSLRQSLSPR